MSGVLLSTAQDTRVAGRALASFLSAGDLIILRGPLGAGKTTFTQGLGAGLQVRGRVTSPTFIISRLHRPLVSGPGLVHVDAYRLGDINDLETLDLDEALSDAVCVVEWGEGKVEALSQNRLLVCIDREVADSRPNPSDPDADADTATGTSTSTDTDTDTDTGAGLDVTSDAASATDSDPDADATTDSDIEALDPRLLQIIGFGPRWPQKRVQEILDHLSQACQAG